MGSNVKKGRKPNDRPIIKLPSAYFSIGSEKAGVPEIASEKCQPSFDVQLEESPIVREGIAVYLQQQVEVFLIMVQGNEVGVLDKRRSRKVLECRSLGVDYIGRIVKVKDQYYGRFFRS